MEVDLTLAGLRSRGFDPWVSQSHFQLELAFWANATGSLVQSLVGAKLDIVLQKSRLTTSPVHARWTKTDGGAGSDRIAFEGTVGGNKTTQTGSTKSQIVVDSTAGMVAGERVRIGVGEVLTTEVEVGSVLDGTQFAPQIELATAPTAGLTVYRGYRAKLVLPDAEVVAPLAKGWWWAFLTLPAIASRQARFWGNVEVLAAAAPA